MTTWINRIKQLLLGFLATHDNKYLITDTGKKLVAFDFTFKNATKNTTSFNGLSKITSVFTNLNKL